MAGDDIRVQVRGDKETADKMHGIAVALTGAPMVDGLRRAAALVSRDAKLIVPVDSGRLKSSITPDVRVKGNVVQGVVGSNKSYAPYVELGTRPHWPPLDALKVWASRHGTTPYVVARGIAAKGTKAYKYLQGSFDKNKDNIKQMIGKVVSEIVS